MGLSFNGKTNPPKITEYDKHVMSAKSYTVGSAVGEVSATKGVKEDQKLVLEKKEVVVPNLVIPTDKLCTVEVGAGRTVNLGNYESARIDVRLTVPCIKEEIDQAYDFATDWVSAKIQEATEQTQK